MNTTNGDKDNEQLAVTAIERGIDGLEPGTVVSKQVAQLIAAALHRDADSELKHFAETGTVINHQATWLFAPLQDHSHKPEELYDIIERCSPAPYLELFARRPRHGWDKWGNEVRADVSFAGIKAGEQPVSDTDEGVDHGQTQA